MSPSHRAHRLAGRLVWPPARSAAAFDKLLRAALEPRLERLEQAVADLREVLELIGSAPMAYPSRVVALGEEPTDLDELRAFVPGDSVELTGHRPLGCDAVVHTLHHAEAHALALGDLLVRLEESTRELRRLLVQEAADDRTATRTALAGLLEELPPPALDVLQERSDAPERAERDAWLRRTRKRLRSLGRVA